MKTYNNLFDKIISFENLLLASHKAQKGKRFKNSTALFNLNLEKELLLLQKDLQGLTYSHGGYRSFYIYDPKRRLISAAPYRDRVVHHALCNIIEPLFEGSFIYDTYACRKDKGTHAAVDRYSVFAHKNRYVLKCDIQKYFQSIDQQILLEIIMGKIRCKKTLWLLKEIISSRQDDRYTFYFPDDDLFSPQQRERGIPIGNLTSQFFANVYLNGFDHFIKEELRCRYYIRYVDDFVILDDSKERLIDVKQYMEEYLGTLRLKLHTRKSRVYRVCDGISFLGYRVFPSHRLLNKGNTLRMRRRLKKLSCQYKEDRITLNRVTQSVRSWIGHAVHADTYRLRERLLEKVVFQKG